MMLGIAGRPESKDGKTLEPLEAYGVQAMSIGFLIDADTPMVWRGPMVTQALEQLLKDTNWRDLDYLVVDMPPGTGDIQLTLAQKVPVTGAVIVTTPQDIALIDARKGLKMFEKVGVPIVGIVENMAIHVCSNCGHAEHIFGEGGARAHVRATTTCRSSAACRSTSASASRPIRARPTVVADPDGRVAEIYATIARKVAMFVAQKAEDFSREVSRTSSSRTRDACGASDRRTATHEHQIRQVDPPHGADARHDRAVRARPGARGRTATGSCRTARRATATTSAARTNSRSSRTSTRRSSIRRISTPKSFVDFSGDVCIIPPNSFALARTVEYFRIPRNVLTICLGKSTYARCGIIVNVTPFEPEWEGYVTLEFSNTTPLPAKIYANEGVAQVIFFESDEVCETSYKDRGGKYQGQQGVTLPKI